MAVQRQRKRHKGQPKGGAYAHSGQASGWVYLTVASDAHGGHHLYAEHPSGTMVWLGKIGAEDPGHQDLVRACLDIDKPSDKPTQPSFGSF